jgi:hypothetical protein
MKGLQVFSDDIRLTLLHQEIILNPKPTERNGGIRHRLHQENILNPKPMERKGGKMSPPIPGIHPNPFERKGGKM